MEKEYTIGGHRFRVSGERLTAALGHLEGFEPFGAGKNGAAPEFIFRDGGTRPLPESGRIPGKELYCFRCDDITNRFGRTDGGYWLEISPDGKEPLRLQMKPETGEAYLYGNYSLRLLRFALWIGYGIMTAQQETVALHGSCIVYREKAVIFLGESGTGKSTHTHLWLEHITGSALLNDDSPVVRYEAGKVWVYGSPWSGKTPCYRTERYPLVACVRLSQAPCNRMRKLNILQGFAALHPSAPPAFAYDSRLYDGVCRTLDQVLSQVPVYRLACLPDREAALLACTTLYPDGN